MIVNMHFLKHLKNYITHWVKTLPNFEIRTFLGTVFKHLRTTRSIK